MRGIRPNSDIRKGGGVDLVQGGGIKNSENGIHQILRHLPLPSVQMPYILNAFVGMLLCHKSSNVYLSCPAERLGSRLFI